MKVLRRLYRYLSTYRAWAVLAFSSMVVFALSQTILMALARPLVDDVLMPPAAQKETMKRDASREEKAKDLILNAVLNRDKPEGRRGWLINHAESAVRNLKAWWNRDPAEKPRKLLTALLIIFVIRALTSFFSEYAFQKVGLSTVRDLRNDLYERIITQSHRFFSDRSTGEMVSRVVSDADAIQAAVSTRMGDLFQESITLLGLTVFVFISNVRLAVTALVVAPLIVATVVHFGKRLRGTTHRSQERMADIATLLEETIRGVRIVKAFTMEKFEIGRFREAARKHLASNLRAQRVQATTSPVIELLAGICTIALFWYAHRLILNGTLSLGQFVSFLCALAAMYAPIKKLNNVNLSVNTAISAAERVFRMLDIDNDVKERSGAIELRGVGSGIRYEHVSFAYDSGRQAPSPVQPQLYAGQARAPVLHDVSLHVHPGEVVALVGGSGAGKSTFVNLLPRFYDVAEGRISIDGHDIRDVTLLSLRKLMAYVTQEVVLFNDTVRNNIAYGRSDADDQHVIDAATAANAHDFIENLPQSYDTTIGESGVLLSGGQRQRIAIARALFKNAPILILDEATSALDTESERLVQQALSNLMKGRTTLVIAHRLSTIRNADTIVVLDQGEIVESGRHEELLACRGTYRRLYDLQFFEEERALA
jgi:ATP-binding cassette, subfamily B, bacterial MsbA